jgi:hypothetical protein
VSFASTLLYWPLWGCIFKHTGFYSSKELGVGYRAYIPTCLPVALDEDGSSLQLCFMLCTRKVEDLYITGFTLYYWCYCNDYLFCTVVLSTDPGNGTNTQEFCLLIRQGATEYDAMPYPPCQSCFVNKLTTSTKINYLGGLVCDGKWSRWVLGHMLVQMCSSGCHSGRPLRIQEINKASMIKVLPVQPYDNMSFVKKE